jgi:glycerol-3-phosphate cytidylyltransferase-like family protein
LDDTAAKEKDQSTSPARLRLDCVSKIEIVSEVLAEAWACSLADWQKRNRQPVRFQPVEPKKNGSTKAEAENRKQKPKS